MIKADPSDIKDDSSCDKALRHLKQLVQDMTCMEVESVDIDRYSSGYEFTFTLR